MKSNYSITILKNDFILKYKNICIEILASTFNYTKEQAEQILLLAEFKGSYRFKKFGIDDFCVMVNLEYIIRHSGMETFITLEDDVIA